MGLLDAAARFRELNAGTDAARYQRLYYPGDSDEERCCRQVIEWVKRELECEAPGEAARRTAELEQELTDYLRRGGPAPGEGGGAGARP
jgi:hypothetical protein